MSNTLPCAAHANGQTATYLTPPCLSLIKCSLKSVCQNFSTFPRQERRATERQGSPQRGLSRITHGDPVHHTQRWPAAVGRVKSGWSGICGGVVRNGQGAWRPSLVTWDVGGVLSLRQYASGTCMTGGGWRVVTLRRSPFQVPGTAKPPTPSGGMRRARGPRQSALRNRHTCPKCNHAGPAGAGSS